MKINGLNFKTRYRTAARTGALPVLGRNGWYSGGGYVIGMRAKTNHLAKRYVIYKCVRGFFAVGHFGVKKNVFFG